MNRPDNNTGAVDAFHAHLDACQQCREHPMDLCPEGARLIHAAADALAAALPSIPVSRR